MSFGFAIGDFIATGELCWRLYREVYEIAKGAPAEVQALHKELSDMSNVIKALIEDVNQPNSAIAEAGADRISLANSVMAGTDEVLCSLKELLKKYSVLQLPKNGPSKRMSLKQMWTSLKYSKEVRTINDLRSKLVYQNGLLTLLLLAGNNSSLERIRSQNEKLLSCVEEIKTSIYGSTSGVTSPLVQAPLDQQSQYELTKALMSHAEIRGQPWTTIGLDDWIQIGKWWLMKAQLHLYSTNIETPESCQAYADLLKASWILTDIIAAHPQMTFVTNGSQQLEIQHLGNVIKAEHKKVEHHLPVKPQLNRIMQSDLNIWGPNSITSLVPKLHVAGMQQSWLWQTDSGEILYQRFGMYLSRSTCSEIECIVVLEARPDVKALNVIAQTPHGQEVLRYNALDWKVQFPVTISSDTNGLCSVTFIPASNYIEPGEKETFRFFDFEAARVFKLLLWLIPAFRAAFPESSFEAQTLLGGALFQYLFHIKDQEKGSSDLEINEDIRRLSGEPTNSLAQSDLSQLWTLARYTSRLSGCPPSFADPRRKLGTPMSLLSLVCWASPTAECALATFDSLVPPSTEDRAHYVAELLQAAIYRQEEAFLVAILNHLNIQPQPTGTATIGSTDVFGNTLLQYIPALKDLVRPYILFWASLNRKHADLLNAILLLTDGKFPGGIEDVLVEAIEKRDILLCNTLRMIATPLNDDFDPISLLLYATITRFYEGVHCIVALYPGRKEPYWIIPALLACHYDIFHCLQTHGYLMPNIDPVVGTDKNAYDYRAYLMRLRSTFAEHSITKVRVDEDANWYLMERLDTGWLLKEGSCHFSLHIAIFLACDPRVIQDLISAGEFVMLKDFSARTQPQVIKHIRQCISVEDARKVFSTTLDRIRRQCKLGKLAQEEALERLFGTRVQRVQSNPYFRSVWFSLLTWDAISTLLDVETGLPNRITPTLGVTKGVEKAQKTGSTQVNRRTSVKMPKSLETQESWTAWREKVCAILEQALKNHVPWEDEKHPETKSGQTVVTKMYPRNIWRVFKIGNTTFSISKNWDLVTKEAQVFR